MANNKKIEEVVLCGVNAPVIQVPEIKVSYKRSTQKKFKGRITTSTDVADFIRSTFNDGEIELQEYFLVIYLTQSMTIIGYYRHSMGGITGTVVDQRIILAVALKCLAVNIILAHNHPSGSIVPSPKDKESTESLKEVAKLMYINVVENLIVTRKGHFSFLDNELLGIPKNNLLAKNLNEFVGFVERDLRMGYQHHKRSIENLARSLQIEDRTEIKELTELAIVNVAREIALGTGNIPDKFERIVKLYHDQVTLSHRTSQSMLLQQYSTPAPIAYLMGVFCNLPTEYNSNFNAFEPSAGNGLLTIAGHPKNILVNEIDFTRNRNLKTQGFKEVTSSDATQTFTAQGQKFNALITNPPFGRLNEVVDYNSFPISDLDHLMSLRGLDVLADNGKAAIIIGSHTRWDALGRIQAGKNRIFFNYLYHHYNVLDVIQIDGHKLYSRQGTGFPVRLILIDGRKLKPQGVAPVKNTETDIVIKSFDALYDRVMQSVNTVQTDQTNSTTMDLKSLEKEALDLLSLLKNNTSDELGSPYMPASQACVVLNTQVPDSMSFETHSALDRIKAEVGGNVDNFVRHRLGYSTHTALCKALSAEQIDAVAMAIYNIEGRNQGTIIGDQTGIGKGRIAAAMIRYGVLQGMKPIFITEKASLFSSLYRDLSAIGSAHLRPFIVNGKESKSDIKDEEGNVIYQALPPSEQEAVFESQEIPAWYDFVAGTYSQFNSPIKKPTKPNFLLHISKDNLFIMDESHNSSGSSNTGEFMQGVVGHTRGVVFLSATFAKRPDNMPIYAMKTAISEANLSKEDLIDAIQKGGVALQEILSSQLVAEGQMIRRERSFEGVEVNYISLDKLEVEHCKIADNVTKILRDIIAFQSKHIDKIVEELDKIAVAEGKEVTLREGTSQAGVDNVPYFSKVFNVINQMLFSIKADAVADRAIERLKEGKKPVIAFASTMGSFIEQMESDSGLPVGDGDLINMDFSEVLRKGLNGIMRYTEKDINGASIYKKFDLSELNEDARAEYEKILKEINSVSTGISISPIDMIVQKLERAGYRVAEVTGRKYSIQPNDKGNKGLVTSRKKIATNDAFRMFNNNEMDVLMINQSGSTGESAHAIITPKVPRSEVKQRVMIVLQAELDINIEVQKRGRTDRTGQIYRPIYDYVTSAISAEKRLMMMLQKKLKSLDANTTSNQKQSVKILDVPDFLNKYGDKIVKEYLVENKPINDLLGDPLHLLDTKGEEDKSEEDTENAAHKVTGRVAVLSTKMQAEFYTEITERYNDYVEYLKQIGEYDLEVEALDLKTETIESSIKTMGKGGESAFGEDSILEKVYANILKKPFKKTDLENLLNETLAKRTPEDHKEELLSEFTSSMAERLQIDINASNDKYEELIKDIPNEKKVQNILLKQGQGAYQIEVKKRQTELSTAKSEATQQLAKTYKNKEQHLERIFNFFTIGRKLAFPIVSFENGTETALAVSLGVLINKKKRNPYAPSAIKIRIAIANSSKYFSIPASFNEDISSIISSSYNIETHDKQELLDEWEEEIKQKTKDRGMRYIVTGNLLQAFSGDTGKLVSYTTMAGDTKKGILMPEEWRPQEVAKQKVDVPILKALPLLKSMTSGTALFGSNEIAFFKAGDKYSIIVPSARSRGGAIYMDQDIWPLITNNKFEISADKMQATMPEANIEQLAKILQTKHSVSIALGQNQLVHVKTNAERISTRKKIVLPPDEDETELERIRLLDLEAEALVLLFEMAA
jgi:DNA repair protein RadC